MSRPSSLFRRHRSLAAACLVGAVLGGSAHAQTFDAGARGGLNLSNVSNIDDGASTSLEWRPAIVAGAFVTWRGLGWIDVQPEVLYSSKGARISEDEVTSRLILDYIEVPVLARVSRRAFGNRRIYGAAGPYFGVRVRAKARTAFSGATEELDISEDVERSDVGVVFGGGIEAGRLVIDGRYALGLSDIDADSTDALEVKNRTFSITAGFRF